MGKTFPNPDKPTPKCKIISNFQDTMTKQIQMTKIQIPKLNPNTRSWSQKYLAMS